MPTFGIWKIPIRRSGSGAQKPSLSQRLYARMPARCASTSLFFMNVSIARCGG
jgi:hypothetical protein